jgi:hypothetical protein
MILTRKIIDREIFLNNWLDELGTLLAEIEDNVVVNPDISIESCKSLLESIAKNILSRLDVTYNEQAIKKLDVHVLLKDASNKLAENVVHGEYELITRFISVVHRMGEIRNERGDISHGRTFPKKTRSTPHFAASIKSFTDGFASHLLTLFFTIDLSYSAAIKYADNIQFNEYLDENNPIEGLSYSKALFDQDFVVYEENLAAFKADLEEEAVVEAKVDVE